MTIHLLCVDIPFSKKINLAQRADDLLDSTLFITYYSSQELTHSKSK